MKKNAKYWIDQLKLCPHPEGGYYNEAFAGSDLLDPAGLPERYSGVRRAYTSIYFLLKSGQVSHLHRLKSDELWNFYTGSPLTVHVIHPDGRYEALKLGPNLETGAMYQHRVPAGYWFGATVDDPDSFSLVGCLVAPGFEFEDFELGDAERLLRRFPQHSEVIKRIGKIS